MTDTQPPPLAIISAIGSRGDVHPMMAIAQGLKERGWRIWFLTSEPYIPLVEAAGIPSHSLISTERFEQFIRAPGLWRPIQGLRILLRGTAAELIEPMYDFLDQHVEPGRTILVTHPLDFASRIYRDLHPEVPMAGAILAPVAIRTPRQPARLTGMAFEIRRPPWLVEWTYWLADVTMVAPWLGRPVNRFRARVGLPPVRRVLREWFLSPDLILGLFPDWFAPSVDLLPAHMALTGFPLEDAGNRAFQEDAAQVRRLLDRHHDPPVVFAPGSANTQAKEYFAVACEACQRLDIHGLLLTEHPEQLPKTLPKNVYHEAYVPFRALLPKCRAIVHHGGIGTTSQALAAAAPQLVVPMAFDQFDNAARVERLGCGRVLPHRKFTSKRLQRTLRQLLEDGEIKRAGEAVAQRFPSAPPTEEAVAKIVELAAQQNIVSDG